MMTEPSGKHGSRLLAGAGVVFALSFATLLTLASEPGTPVPISGLLPLLFLVIKSIIGIPVVIGLLLLAYFGWFRPASTGQAQFTSRTWLVLAISFGLSAYWYCVGWGEGMRWQGRGYTIGCAIISAMQFGAVVAAGIIGRQASLPWAALLGRWLALVWVVTYGYPFLSVLH